jgi:hypothetical protein
MRRREEEKEEPAALADETEELLSLILSPASTPPRRIDGIVVGRLIGIAPPRVVFSGGEPAGVEARAMGGALVVGGEVGILCEEGDPARPVILGPMAPPATAEAPRSAPLALEVDGARVEIAAAEELVLRCGEASITLTREGKVIVHGVYVSSRATGVHRIQGGTVEIN